MYAWYKIILSPFFSPFFPSYTYSQLTFPLPQYFSFTSLALLILLPPFLSSIMGGFGTEVSYCWTSTKFGVLVFAVWCERYYDSCWSFSSLGHLFSTVTRPYSENVCDTAHVRFGLMILSHFVWANYVRVPRYLWNLYSKLECSRTAEENNYYYFLQKPFIRIHTNRNDPKN